jgi:hypothetical protein
MSKYDIDGDARRHSRGHLRHPKVLGLAGHNKPVSHLKVNRNVCFVRLCVLPPATGWLLSDSSQGEVHRRCVIPRYRARFDKVAYHEIERATRKRLGAPAKALDDFGEYLSARALCGASSPR